MDNKRINRIKRHTRIRAKVSGTKEVPRVAVFRSNQHIYAQMIDDTTGTTLASIHDITKTKGKVPKKSDRAAQIGEKLAEKAKALGITKIVFDRGGYQYHGRIKALAESLRKGGLIF